MYVARHHLKESQAPPAEWGPTRRVRPGRGYWSRPSEDLRTEAKALVREKRLRRRLEQLLDERLVEEGVELLGDEIEEQLQRMLETPPPTVVRICDPWEDDHRAA